MRLNGCCCSIIKTISLHRSCTHAQSLWSGVNFLDVVIHAMEKYIWLFSSFFFTRHKFLALHISLSLLYCHHYVFVHISRTHTFQIHANEICMQQLELVVSRCDWRCNFISVIWNCNYTTAMLLRLVLLWYFFLLLRSFLVAFHFSRFLDSPVSCLSVTFINSCVVGCELHTPWHRCV